MHLGFDAAVVGIALEVEGHVPRGAGKVMRGAVEEDGAHGRTASAGEGNAEVFLLQHAGLGGRSDGPGEEQGLAMAIAKGLEHFLGGKQVLAESGEGNFRVESQAGDEHFVGEEVASGGLERGAKARKGGFVDIQTGCHLVPAEVSEVAFAAAEGLDDGEAFDAAAAAFAVAGFVETHDERGPVVAAGNAGRDDAEHALMPVAGAGDDAGIAGGVEMRVDPGFDLLGDGALHALALAVLRIEAGGQPQGLGGIVGEEKLEGFLRGAQAARGVDAGAEAEAEIGGADGRGNARHGEKRGEAGPARAGHLVQSGADEDAIFSDERDEIAERGKGDQVKHLTKVEAGERRGLEEGMSDFEDDAHAAQVGKSPVAELGVHQCGAGGQRGFGFVVIEHDHVDAAVAQRGDLGGGIRAAIHGHEKVGRMEFHAAFEAGCAEAVAFAGAQGQEALHAAAVGAEHAVEQGEGGDTIHIVVAIEDDALARPQGSVQAVDGGGHAGQEIWIRKGAQPGLEETFDGFAGLEAGRGEKIGDETRQAVGADEGAGGGGVHGFGQDPPAFHGEGMVVRNGKWEMRNGIRLFKRPGEAHFSGMSIERTLLAAQGYIELEMPGEALRELDELPPADQECLEVLQVRLFIHMRARRWGDALEVCDHLRERDPHQSTGFIHGAFCLHELGRTREAKELLLKGPATLLREATYYYNMGCYDAVLGNLEDAQHALEISFRMDDKFREIAKYDPDLKAVMSAL